MKRRPGSTTNSSEDVGYIFENAFGRPIELQAAPTTAGGELPRDGDSGWFSTNLYINLGGSVYRFAGTLV